MTAVLPSPWHARSDMAKKCIVLDLDNTLWGGIVGEDGVRGISLSHRASGAHFVAFQQALRDLHDRGVILAINSRNTPEEAWEAIHTHPDMILKESHFAAVRINWNDKVENMRELAEELRIGLDSMVFLDDDPVNRSAMRALLPEVETPDLPRNSADYAKFLISLPYFPERATTDEDALRGNLYVTERLRMESEKAFATREEFLASLGLELRLFKDDASALPRLAQLTEKTNQFNANKRPMSESEIRAAMEDSSSRVFHGRVTDRFGDSGITALALVRNRGDEWHMESFLISCRVLGRGIEDAFLAGIAKYAQKEGVSGMTIDFVPSPRNKPAADFIERAMPGLCSRVRTVRIPAWISVSYGNF